MSQRCVGEMRKTANGRNHPRHNMDRVDSLLGATGSGQLKFVDTPVDDKSAVQPRSHAPTYPAAPANKNLPAPAPANKNPPAPANKNKNPPAPAPAPAPANKNPPVPAAVNDDKDNSSLPLPLPLRPRNQSPYTRPHLRSRSHASALAPPMAPRAHSLPSVHSAGHQYPFSPSASPLLRPSSPMSSLSPRQSYSPNMRPTSPFRPRSPLDESAYNQQSLSHDGAFESISEDAELNITPRSHPDNTLQPAPFGRSLSLRRQRPSSPLPATPRSTSATSSPSIPAARFNDNFPQLHSYSSNSSFSSISTTPSSARSRSPSISSLETIEDNPDLEWEAIEADRAAKQRAAAEAEEQVDGTEPRRRGSLDIPGHKSVGFGFGRRGGDAGRKRWSICGGERTVDLDLETIWED